MKLTFLNLFLKVLLSHKIHVFHHLADPTANVEKHQLDKRYAHAYQTILALLLIVDPNVQAVTNAQTTWRV